MSHSVISLQAQTTRATILLDHMTKEHSDGLAHQMERIFRPNEYLRLTDGELSLEKDHAAEKMRDVLYQRISIDRSLIDSGYKFIFAFFEEIGSLDEKRLDLILSFLHATKLLLGAPGLEINAYLCVSKARQDTAAAMENMDRCADRLLKEGEAEVPRILLIDALPLRDTEPWMRAVARALNVLSRDNVLSNRFQGSFYRNTIWNWTLTEFDVDAREEDERIARELNAMLNQDLEFPIGTLQQNFKSLVDRILSRHKAEMELPAENVPIPANVIGCCLKRRSLQPNADAFAKLVERYFLENVTKKVISSIASQDMDRYCRELVGEGNREIPLSCWNRIESELKKLGDQTHSKAPRSLREYPLIAVSGLSPCSKVEKMRELLRDTLTKCTDTLRKAIPQYVQLMLQEHIGDFVRREEQKKRRQIEEKLRSIGGTMANVQDAPDYLHRLGELNEKMMSIRMLDCHSQNVYLLISDRTNGEWSSLYDEHLNLNNCEVFNYHSLEEFEFQSLMLTTWDQECYFKNHERIFRQDQQGM